MKPQSAGRQIDGSNHWYSVAVDMNLSNMRYRLAVIGVVLIAAVSCATSEDIELTVSAAVAATLETMPTVVATPTPMAITVPTSLPTVALVPTATPTSVPILQPTQSPTPTPTPEPTYTPQYSDFIIGAGDFYGGRWSTIGDDEFADLTRLYSVSQLLDGGTANAEGFIEFVRLHVKGIRKVALEQHRQFRSQPWTPAAPDWFKAYAFPETESESLAACAAVLMIQERSYSPLTELNLPTVAACPRFFGEYIVDGKDPEGYLAWLDRRFGIERLGG